MRSMLWGAVLSLLGVRVLAADDALVRLGSTSAAEQAAAINEIVAAGEKYIPDIETAYAKLTDDQRELRERYRDVVARIRTEQVRTWAVALAPSLGKKVAWDAVQRNLGWTSKPATLIDARKALCLVSRSVQGWEEAEAVKLFKVCMDDQDPAVRAAAVSALDREEWKGPAVELLVATLKDESEKVRAAAGSILVSRGDQRGLATVLAGAVSPDASVRDQCSQIIPSLIVSEEGQPQRPRFKHTTEEVAILGKLLALEDMNSRGTVARLLGMIGDKSAVPALLEALSKESFPKNRRRIANSLGLLRYRPAAAALIGLLKAPAEKLRGEKQDYAWGVGGSWAQIGDPDSVPAMMALLGDRKTSPYAAAALSWAFGMDGLTEDYTRGGGPTDVLVPAADGKFTKQSTDKAPKGEPMQKLWENFWSANKGKYSWSDAASTLCPAPAKPAVKK